MLPAGSQCLFEGVGGNEGLKLYWDAENNQVAGRPVQFIFEDTEGNLWEVAHNPAFPIDPEGRISLPE